MQKKIANPGISKIRKIVFYNRFIGFTDYRLKKFIKAAALRVKKGEKILDAGAGECQYKKYFNHAEYISQDSGVGDNQWDFSKIDINSEIYDIPVIAGSFDHILCIEVLEHLKYPQRAFEEFSRILKSGGSLFVVCPLTWGEHQKPHDYFRYTQFALRMLAEENGFYVNRIEKQGGKFICLAQIITEIGPSFFIDRGFIKIGYFFKIVLFPINYTIAVVFYFLDKADKVKDIVSQYECIFVKK